MNCPACGKQYVEGYSFKRMCLSCGHIWSALNDDPGSTIQAMTDKEKLKILRAAAENVINHFLQAQDTERIGGRRIRALNALNDTLSELAKVGR